MIQFCHFCKVKCKNPSCTLTPIGEGMTTKYRTPFDLPVRWKSERGIHIENEFIFGIYENIVKERPATTEALKRYYNAAKLRGFPNHIVSSVPEKEISHDQLTAYTGYSYMNNLDGHLQIWKNCSFLRYGGRFLRLRDYLHYGNLAGNKYTRFVSPILLTSSMIITALNFWNFDKGEKKTSSMMLWLLRLHIASKNKDLSKLYLLPKVVFNIATKLRYGSQNELISEYFRNNPEHPIVKNLQNK